MSTDKLAARLTAAADLLAGVDRSVAAMTASPGTFGAAGSLGGAGGTPSRVGLALHEHWLAVLAARGREVADASARVRDLADGVRRTGRDYTGADESAARRIERNSR